MTNLLNKLNVLVRSSLNSFLEDVSGQGSPSAGRVPVDRLGPDIDQEIAALRKRIDQAVADEDTMQKRLDQLQRQIDTYDRQADAALQSGDEAGARYLVQQMQQQQQLASMVQTDLEQHRQSTSDLIQRVNTLDALVTDARRAQQQEPPAEATPSAPAADTQTQPDRSPGAVLSDLLREARERVEKVTTSPDEPAQSVPVNIQGKVNDTQVDDDLAKRRARLSKPE
jgi:phage shock protein A